MRTLMHRSHFSFMSAGLCQPWSTFQFPVYLNLLLMGPGEFAFLKILFFSPEAGISPQIFFSLFI